MTKWNAAFFTLLALFCLPSANAQFATIDPGNGTQIELSQNILEQLDFLITGKLTLTFPVHPNQKTTLKFTALQNTGEVLVRFLREDGSYNPPIHVSAQLANGKTDKRKMDDTLQDFRALISPQVTLGGAAEYSFQFTEAPTQTTFVTIVVLSTEPEAAVLSFAVASE